MVCYIVFLPVYLRSLVFSEDLLKTSLFLTCKPLKENRSWGVSIGIVSANQFDLIIGLNNNNISR